jgi:hypothetical protein
MPNTDYSRRARLLLISYAYTIDVFGQQADHLKGVCAGELVTGFSLFPIFSEQLLTALSRSQ